MASAVLVCPMLAAPQRSRAQSPTKKGCGSSRVVRKGFFVRTSDRARIQRFLCKDCGHCFSERTTSCDYRTRSAAISDFIECHLVSGVSQRRIALLLGIGRDTIARRIPALAHAAREELRKFRERIGPRPVLQFDEMRSFEHTKMKPLFIPLLVDEGTQAILGVGVARAPADGPLAERSRVKYGLRPNEKSQVRRALLASVKDVLGEAGTVKTDEESSYPKEIREAFPQREHLRFKGRKACVVGQGELKQGGRDPLFALNHTAAMVRDNLKRLARRTWCTTKRPEVLRDLLDIYAWFHNSELLPRRARRRETQVQPARPV